MYLRKTSLGCVAFLFVFGCDGSDHQRVGEGASNSAFETEELGMGDLGIAEQQTVAGQEHTSGQAGTRSTPVDTTPATRSELDRYLGKFRSEKNWTYGERQPAQLSGTWVALDSDGNRVVFDVDGVPGTFGQDFAGNMTAGVYAVSENNRVVCFSKWNGIGLGAHFTLVGETLTGPLGPNPAAQWQRIAPVP